MESPFVILLWVSTVVDWWAAQGLVRAQRPAARRAWMLLSVVANLGMLGFFKYGRRRWGPPVPADVILSTVERTRVAVAKIRARGGDVVFVRPPSAPEMRVYEDKAVSRAQGWDRLLAGADVRGAYFADYPAMQGLALPEDSHLTRACATVFTDAYVRALAGLSPALTVRAAAPRPLSAADCNAAEVPRGQAASPAVGKPIDP